MNGFTLLIGSAVIFLIAYVVYGSWLAKQWGIDPKRKTPAETQKDGIDYLPTKPAVLLGHHFSSIAGAGPIVGPITAAVFGWVPVTLWIIVGSVFFGGVHDYGSLVASLRHRTGTAGGLKLPGWAVPIILSRVPGHGCSGSDPPGPCPDGPASPAPPGRHPGPGWRS